MKDSILRIPSVTGVDVELRIAGPGGRSYAFVIDWHIRVLAAVAWLVVGALIYFGAVGPVDGLGALGAGAIYTIWVPSAAIYLLYHPILELMMKGRTPGKRIAGVRLVGHDGATPGIAALLIRNVFRLVDSLPFAYCIGLAATMLTERSLRIGDLAAGTVLVYDDKKKGDEFRDLTTGAIERLGLEQAQIVTDLLARWEELDPAVRARLATRLLAPLGKVPAHDAGDPELRARLERLLS